MMFGIPILLDQGIDFNIPPDLLTSDGIDSFYGDYPIWGIYNGETAVIVPDSMISIEFKSDNRVLNYPIQKGSFQSYNKLITPYSARIRMTKSGTDADRQEFLSSIDAAANSLDVYDIVMPDTFYNDANITGYEYKRTSENGVGLLSVEILLQQVLTTATEDFSRTASENGASPANVGLVKPTAASATLSADASAAQGH